MITKIHYLYMFFINFKTIQDITQTVPKPCDLLHGVKTRLGLSANQNAGLQTGQNQQYKLKSWSG